MKADLCNGLTLAYIGDAYYELLVREKLINAGIGRVNDLHKGACKYTAGANQAHFILKMIEDKFLTEHEIDIYKKGRNCHSNHTRKNLDLQIYQKATGFEALIGYLYLEGNIKRIHEIMEYIEMVVESDGKENR